jgi:hypothetical protein
VNKKEYINIKTLVKNLENIPECSRSSNESLFITTAKKLISVYEEQSRIKMVQEGLQLDNMYKENSMNNLFYPENVGKFKVGKVVKRKELDSSPFYSIGHIIGFKLNAFNEIIVEVQWANKSQKNDVSSVHPSQIELL